MKHLHKFASVLLALVMAFSLMAPAFATETTSNLSPVEGPQTITISNATVGHTYTAYQVFKGDLDAAIQTPTDLRNPVLSNIDWGDHADSAAILAAIVAYENHETLFPGITASSSAADVAAVLTEDNAVDFSQAIASTLKTSNLSATATGETVKIENVPIGYYLIKDTAADDATGTAQAVSLYMLQVVGPTEVVSKVGTPTPDKTVKDVNDSTTDDPTWSHTADHDIGDVIEYELKATLPKNIESYKSYKLVFTDEMSAGLTLVNKDSVTGQIIYLTDVDMISNNLVVKVDGQEITSGFEAAYVMGEEGKTTLTVTFDNVMAATVGASSESVITIGYKALLNENAAVKNENSLTLTYPRNPNTDGDGEPETGTTPPVIAVVFTFKTIINKVQPDPEDPTKNISLAGAKFELDKWNPTGGDNENGAWEKIEDATISENDTRFTFNGLDDGLYRLRETVTPAGFNSIPNVYFKVEAKHSDKANGLEEGVLDELTVTQVKEDGSPLGEGETIILNFTPNKDEGSASTDVVNRSGAQLPETGGIGTTIFYVVGGLLTVGAVVLLVTKKRMSADSDK